MTITEWLKLYTKTTHCTYDLDNFKLMGKNREDQ